jgi:transposase-like protein
MPKRYAREFRRSVCERLVASEKVSSLSREFGVSEATLYLWKRHAFVDAGQREGTKSFEADELAAGLQDHRRARSRARDHQGCRRPLQRRGARPPKRRCQLAQGLSKLGYRERAACRVAGVSRSCVYEFKYHVPSDRQIRRLLVSGLVADIHNSSPGTYGMLRIRAALMRSRTW